MGIDLKRTLLVSLHSGDESSKSELSQYLASTNDASLFITVLIDGSATAAGRILAITILCEAIKPETSLPWHKEASTTVHNMVAHENEEIASAAAKYATDEAALEHALEHKSVNVRKVAAKRLRELIKQRTHGGARH